MRATVALVALAALLPASAGAQSVSVPLADVTPAERSAPPAAGAVSLADAVQIAVRHTPAVASAAVALRGETGRLQTARGAFDGLFRVAPSVGYSRTPATPFVLEREANKRFQLERVAEGFGRVFSALNALLDDTSTAAPECPDGLTTEVSGVTLERTDPIEASLLGTGGDLPAIVVRLDGVPVQSLFATDDICSQQPGVNFNTETLNALYRRVDQAGSFGLRDVLVNLDPAADEIRRLQREIAEAVTTRASLSLLRLGAIPEDLEKVTASIAVSYDEPFHNGLAIGFDLNLSASETNFDDKLLDPGFGNLGQQTTFPSRASASLFVPLGRGLGATGNAAQERAAAFTVAARREQLRHQLAEETFRTALSYVNLVAAQQRLQLLEESLARQQKLLSLTDQRVQASDLPGVDLERARAQAAGVAGNVSAARRTLLEARVDFAETIGLNPASLDQVPTAGGAFAETLPPIPQAGALMQAFGTQRRDVKALQYTRTASAALVAGSQADLRRRFDLTITGGMSNLYESPFFRYFEDERFPLVDEIDPADPEDSPVRALWPRGWWRSLTGRWEPFVSANFSIDVPFGNNRAKGRLAQAQANLRRTEIQQVELTRATGESLVSVTGALQRAAEAVERSRATVKSSEETLEGTLSSFDAAETTLIDTLLTEEELTRARLELVRQLQAFASTYVRLKYEAGDLVAFEQEGTDMETVRFDPLPIVTR